jgi:hypothetical protein
VDEFVDPRAFRWVESGVSGLARTREWDATVLIELPELRADVRTELDLIARPEGVEGPADLPDAALERLLRRLELSVERPFVVRAVRQGALEWLAAARRLRSELISIRAPARALELALPPGGERWVVVDGEGVSEPLEPPLAEAVDELERRGRERFQAFVARADKVGTDSWELTIDPL